MRVLFRFRTFSVAWFTIPAWGIYIPRHSMHRVLNIGYLGVCWGPPRLRR